MGRHSPDYLAQQRRRTIEMVDTTGTAHLLTTDAAADGYRQGRYIAVCGDDVVPAALVATMARYCPLCPVPAQRRQ